MVIAAHAALQAQLADLPVYSKSRGVLPTKSGLCKRTYAQVDSHAIFIAKLACTVQTCMQHSTPRSALQNFIIQEYYGISCSGTYKLPTTMAFDWAHQVPAESQHHSSSAVLWEPVHKHHTHCGTVPTALNCAIATQKLFSQYNT